MASSYGNHTTTAPWDQVIPLQGEIERIVAAASRRGVITPADVDDAVQDAMVYAAVGLWAKYDPSRGTFAAYALHSIHTRLLSRRGTDALNKLTTDIDSVAPLTAPAVSASVGVEATATVADLSMIPRGLQVAAKLLMDGWSIERIAKKLYRDPVQLRRMLRPWKRIGRPRKVR